MKTISYSAAADKFLAQAAPLERTRIEAAIERYAMTGEGDAIIMEGVPARRMRIGRRWRVVFIETPDQIIVIKVGNRADIYE